MSATGAAEVDTRAPTGDVTPALRVLVAGTRDGILLLEAEVGCKHIGSQFKVVQVHPFVRRFVPGDYFLKSCYFASLSEL